MLYINGRFLTQKVTGVQRYAIEVVKAIDHMVKKNSVIILCPHSTKVTNLNLKNIRVMEIGKFSGHLWEQLSLPLFVKKRKGILLNLCNLGPVLYPGFVTIHDISFKTNSSHLNKKFVIWYRIITRLNIKRYSHIFTVSNFSKDEIISNYKVKESKITVTYNSAEHLNNIVPDNSILKKHSLIKGKYYFSLGSNSKHKNFIYIYELAKENKSTVFVVTGNNNSKSFASTSTEKLDNLIYTGYLNDNELVALYKNCKAFIFPSLYEGFGIPPLEAVTAGCQHLILSDISVLKEIYGNNAVYVDAKKDFIIPKKLVLANREELCNKFSWKSAAKEIMNRIGE